MSMSMLPSGPGPSIELRPINNGESYSIDENAQDHVILNPQVPIGGKKGGWQDFSKDAWKKLCSIAERARGVFEKLKSAPQEPDSTPTIHTSEKVQDNLEITVREKKYRILRFRQRIGEGEWKEIDLSKLSGDERRRFMSAAETACGVFGKLKGAPEEIASAHTFTMRFHQEPEFGPGVMNLMLGRFFESYAWRPEPKILKEITYKISEDSEEETFKVHFEQYAPKEQEEILKTTWDLMGGMRRIASAQTSSTKKLKKNTPPVASLVEGPTAPLLSAIHKNDASENKCTALSIAQIMQSQGDARSIKEISKELIESSIRKIEEDNGFIDPKDSKHAELTKAILDYNKVREKDKIANPANSLEIARAEYVQKLRISKGEMLDSPFFFTLDKPTIILEIKEKAFKVLKYIPDDDFMTAINELTLEDLKRFNIVLYVNQNYEKNRKPSEDQNHYEAVIPTEAAHLEALKHVLQKNVNS